MRIHYQDFMIFFTFLLFWISIQFGQIIEDSIAYIIVLSIGIVHGSNDFTILKKQQNSKIDFLKSTAPNGDESFGEEITIESRTSLY